MLRHTPTLSLLIAALAAPLPSQQFVDETERFAPHYSSAARGAGYGDIDGDGDFDRYVFGTTNEIFRNDLSGWTAFPHANAGARAAGLLVDLDGDGLLDVLNPIRFSTGASEIYWGNGTIDFVGAQVSTLGTGVGASDEFITVFDADNDGDLDVLRCFVGGVNHTSMLFLQDPVRSFRTATMQEYDLSNLRIGMCRPAVADFDGDGLQDFALASAIGETRLFLQRPGQMAAAPAAALPTQPGADHTAAAAADVDGDGDIDLVLGGGTSGSSLWLNDGSAAFTLAAASGLAALSDVVPGGLQLADATGDGVPDVFALRDGQDMVFANDGTGAFTLTAIDLGTTDAHTWVAFADVNGDGLTDVQWADFDTTSAPTAPLGFVGEALAAGTGFAHPRRYALPRRAAGRGFGLSLAVSESSDMDGDGAADIVHTPALGTEVSILRNDGDGLFDRDARPRPDVGDRIEAFALADLDGDGATDVAVAHRSGIAVCWNDGSGGLSLAQVLPVAAGVYTILAFDADGDGLLEVCASGGGIQLLDHESARTFSVRPQAQLPPYPPGLRPWRAFDADSDGDLDLLMAGSNPRLWINDGNGGFTDQTLGRLPHNYSGNAPIACDADGDGDLDIVYDGPPYDGLLENIGGVFVLSPGRLPGTRGSTSGGRAVDVDDDGDIDLFLRPAQLLINDGTGRFADETNARLGPVVSLTPLFVDVDEDGDLDLIPTLEAAPTVRRNEDRGLSVVGVARVGGNLDLEVTHQPGYGPGGLAIGGVGFGRTALAVAPGVTWTISPIDLVTVGPFAIGPTGGSVSARLPVPATPNLAGLEVFSQFVLFSMAYAPGLGVTNAVATRILP